MAPSEVESQPLGNRDAGSRKLDLAAAERAANGKLSTCRRVVTAVDAVVETLSQAGSNLQRTLNDVLNGPEGLEVALAGEDPLVWRAAQSAFGACGGVGAALIDLAASLSGGLQQPLQDLERAVTADRAQRSVQLDDLRRQHQACTGALTDSLRRKERLSSDLRAAMGECDSEKSQGRSWFGKSSKPSDAEAKLRKVMMLQTTAVEEFGERVEQAFILSDSAQQETEALSDALLCVDFAVKQTLHLSLQRCSGAWKVAAGSLQTAAQQLSADSTEVAAAAPRIKGRKPSWAIGLLKSANSCDGGSVTKLLTTEAIKADDPSWAESPARNHQDADANDPSDEVNTVSEATMTSEAQELEATALEKGWAELDAQKKAFRETQEVREIQLLEQEEGLRGMQARLDSQLEQFAERRRCLALDQARCLALLEHTSALGHGPAYIKMDDNRKSLSRSGTGSPSLDAQQRSSDDLTDTDSGEEGEDEGKVDGDVDSVWDMDWTLPRNISGQLIEPLQCAKDTIDEAAAPAVAGIATPATDSPSPGPASKLAEGPTNGACEEEPEVRTPTAEEKTRGPRPGQHTRPSRASLRAPPPSPGDEERITSKSTAEFETIRQRLEKRRQLNQTLGSELPVPHRPINIKGRMPGVHPDVAEKLEARRRVIEASEVGAADGSPI